jgi:hypothetical protein
MSSKCKQVSVSYRPSTPTYKLQVKSKSGACTHAPPHALQHRTLPPSRDELQGYHVSSGSRSRLPDRVGSETAMCPVALDLAFLQGRAPVRHLSYSSRSYLPAGEGFGAPCVLQLWILHPAGEGFRVTCPTVLDPASLQGRALEHRVCYGSESCLPTGRASVPPPRALRFPVDRGPQIYKERPS